MQSNSIMSFSQIAQPLIDISERDTKYYKTLFDHFYNKKAETNRFT